MSKHLLREICQVSGIEFDRVTIIPGSVLHTNHCVRFDNQLSGITRFLAAGVVRKVSFLNSRILNFPNRIGQGRVKSDTIRHRTLKPADRLSERRRQQAGMGELSGCVRRRDSLCSGYGGARCVAPPIENNKRRCILNKNQAPSTLQAGARGKTVWRPGLLTIFGHGGVDLNAGRPALLVSSRRRSVNSPSRTRRSRNPRSGLLGANRTTNANMLSLCCEFLKRPQGRWFQRFG
jgi:hypothetical protein